MYESCDSLFLRFISSSFSQYLRYFYQYILSTLRYASFFISSYIFHLAQKVIFIYHPISVLLYFPFHLCFSCTIFYSQYSLCCWEWQIFYQILVSSLNLEQVFFENYFVEIYSLNFFFEVNLLKFYIFVYY